MTSTLSVSPAVGRDDSIEFTASGVTSSESIAVRFDRAAPTDAVARSIAHMLGMPSDTGYALREDRSSRYLGDGAIGDQLGPDARVTVTPKTHLGGCRGG